MEIVEIRKLQAFQEITTESRRSSLELFIEPNHGSFLQNCDNITLAPTGDLILCEDGPGTDFLVDGGLTAAYVTPE